MSSSFCLQKKSHKIAFHLYKRTKPIYFIDNLAWTPTVANPVHTRDCALVHLGPVVFIPKNPKKVSCSWWYGRSSRIPDDYTNINRMVGEMRRQARHSPPELPNPRPQVHKKHHLVTKFQKQTNTRGLLQHLQANAGEWWPQRVGKHFRELHRPRHRPSVSHEERHDQSSTSETELQCLRAIHRRRLVPDGWWWLVGGLRKGSQLHVFPPSWWGYLWELVICPAEKTFTYFY